MKRTSLVIAVLLSPLAVGTAMADDDDCYVPMANWQPRHAVQQMAESKGWTVRRIKTDDGCYEIKGRDENGREIEVKVDPATLVIVKIEYEDDECYGAKANWQPREAVRQMAENNGWTVRRIKTDDGCYEIKGRDENGRKFEVKVDPITLMIVEIEYKNKGDDARDSGKNTAPIGLASPPDNGLFNKGAAPVIVE